MSSITRIVHQLLILYKDQSRVFMGDKRCLSPAKSSNASLSVDTLARGVDAYIDHLTTHVSMMLKESISMSFPSCS